MEKHYEVSGAPERLGEDAGEGRQLLTAAQISRATGMPLGLTQRRLQTNGWRRWEQLAQSVAAAKAAQLKGSKARMAAEMGENTRLAQVKRPYQIDSPPPIRKAGRLR